MRIVLPGGSGQVGQLLSRHFAEQGHDVVVLSRSGTAAAGRALAWDGKTIPRTVFEIAVKSGDLTEPEKRALLK